MASLLLVHGDPGFCFMASLLFVIVYGIPAVPVFPAMVSIPPAVTGVTLKIGAINAGEISYFCKILILYTLACIILYIFLLFCICAHVY